MIIFPAIDLLDGNCVRLIRGEKRDCKVYSTDPVEVALRWQGEGAEWLHIVDLNGAIDGTPFANLNIVKNILQAVSIPIQVGGGIRSAGNIREYLSVGASRVILSTAVLESREFAGEVFAEFRDKIAVSLDSREGKVSTRGWTSTAEISTLEAVRRMEDDGASVIVLTDILRDGTLSHPNFDMIAEVAAATGLKIIASGGFSSYDDLLRIKNMKEENVIGAIVGKALYEGSVGLKEAIRTVSRGAQPCAPTESV
ncbi:MAG: 1-(5-phosphoribosyl)-5-[(5-phosphoribosylamino)methylideneamino]imidazole-4-carboxamide isomerase [bacterium]